MPHPCVVCGRSRMNPNNRAEEYTFFGFPVNDETRCKKWLEFCCREELYKLTKKQLLQRMVCSKHFEQSDFVNDFYDRLNTTAVPSIYDPKQSLYNIGCVLCGRFRKSPPGSENDGATFHHFPGEEFRCLDWLDFVGVDSYYRLTRKEIMFCFICSKHFDRSQFMGGFHNRLKDNAVPNIKYPDENEDEENQSDNGIEHLIDIELFNTCEKSKKIDSLPPAVLESQACAACGRKRTDPRNRNQKYKFHPFPAYEIGRCLKWCQFLGREDILRMSPNQIRRLVLCSVHFQTGQNFNNGNGPCDAIPTIHKVDDKIETVTDSEETLEQIEENKAARALVSSKKPKIDPDNKPTPLAKKRGKSRRPIAINLPKIVAPKINNYTIKKLPIPTANNWKLIANQFQPITLSNNVVSNITPEIKKVILPFTGNISNLGAPIPVQSLSSIPPGLLFKIDLPDKDKNCDKPVKKRGRRKVSEKIQAQPVYSDVTQKVKRMKFIKQEIDIKPDSEPENSVTQLTVYPEISSRQIDGDVEMHDAYFNDFEEVEEETIIGNEYTDYEVEEEIIEETKPKVKMSGRCRRTLMPIQSELRRFLNKLKPHVRRLPKKSKAQVKLAIVNMVIDRL